MRSFKAMVCVVGCGWLQACSDSPPSAPAPAAPAAPAQAVAAPPPAPAPTTPVASAATDPACPSVSQTLVDAPIAPGHGLRVAFQVPQGFVWSASQDPVLSEALLTARFELPFQNTSVKRHAERLMILQVEQRQAVPSANAVPLPAQTLPYVMGSGAEDEASADAVVAGQGLLAGELSFEGQQIPVFRQPGKQTARFNLRLPEGESVRDLVITLSVAKTYPVVVSDMAGEACVADFDRIGLAVARSLTRR